MQVVTKIIRYLFRQNCILCKQGADEIICDYCFNILQKQLNKQKQNIILDDEYDYYYLFDYSEDVKSLLKRFKFKKDILINRVFEMLIYEWYKDFAGKYLENVDELVVVPIHRLRYLYRGFNQAELLGQTIANCIGIYTDFVNCERTKYTKAQAKSDKKQRQIQVKNVFKIKKPIQAKHLIVFDDVMTTGSTIQELIVTIKQTSQVEKISVVSLARAG